MAGPPRDASKTKGESIRIALRGELPDIYAYVLRRVGTVEVSGVVQDVFATAWRSAARMPGSTAGPALASTGSPRRAVSTLSAACFVVTHCSIASKLSPTSYRADADPRISSTFASRVRSVTSGQKTRTVLRLILWDEIDRSTWQSSSAAQRTPSTCAFHRP